MKIVLQYSPLIDRFILAVDGTIVSTAIEKDVAYVYDEMVKRSNAYEDLIETVEKLEKLLSEIDRRGYRNDFKKYRQKMKNAKLA